jgi:hypothetical protein
MIPPLWFPIALSYAFGVPFATLLNKYQVKRVHPIVTLFMNQAFTLAFMLITLILLGGIPHVTLEFFSSHVLFKSTGYNCFHRVLMGN